jgi:hypothetical protein
MALKSGRTFIPEIGMQGPQIRTIREVAQAKRYFAAQKGMRIIGSGRQTKHSEPRLRPATMSAILNRGRSRLYCSPGASVNGSDERFGRLVKTIREQRFLRRSKIRVSFEPASPPQPRRHQSEPDSVCFRSSSNGLRDRLRASAHSPASRRTQP